jgi:uncharacterized SAM-dependent methyltransferase
VEQLSQTRNRFGRGSLLILGVDLIKDDKELLRAYDNPESLAFQYNLRKRFQRL